MKKSYKSVVYMCVESSCGKIRIIDLINYPGKASLQISDTCVWTLGNGLIVNQVGF